MPITPRAEVTERVTELHISDGHHVKQNSKKQKLNIYSPLLGMRNKVSVT